MSFVPFHGNISLALFVQYYVTGFYPNHHGISKLTFLGSSLRTLYVMGQTQYLHGQRKSKIFQSLSFTIVKRLVIEKVKR